MGTPEFAVPALEKLIQTPELANIVAIYTQPDRPAGRGHQLQASPIKTCALKNHLNVFQPENINEPDEKRKLADLMADVVVVVAYAQFLSKAILNTPRLGCINIHSSLLPKYRGASPIHYTVLNGDEKAGITTMRLVQKMDAGPMLLQKSMPLDDKMTTRELMPLLSQLGGELIIETLQGLRSGTLKEIDQDESQVSYAKILKKEDGLIQWASSGRQIINQIRAFDPWPGTFVHSNKGILKIIVADFLGEVIGTKKNQIPGTINTETGDLLVRCSDGWIKINKIQQEGKKAVSAHDFLNGLQNQSLILLEKNSQ